jgi:hypothetical protein
LFWGEWIYLECFNALYFIRWSSPYYISLASEQTKNDFWDCVKGIVPEMSSSIDPREMFSHLERIAGTRAMLEICSEFIEAKMSKFNHNRAAVDPTWIQPPSPRLLREAEKKSIDTPFTHQWDDGYNTELAQIRRRVVKGNGIKKVIVEGEDKVAYNLRMSPLRPS